MQNRFLGIFVSEADVGRGVEGCGRVENGRDVLGHTPLQAHCRLPRTSS